MTQLYSQPYISSLHERPSERIIQDPYSPRKFQPSHYSSHQFEGSSWNSLQPRSPMSGHRGGLYESHSAKSGDMYQTKPETPRNPPREQLPPLSSLFGSSSHPRPAQSPYSDRPSPVFPSPLDTRQSATPLHSDRSYDGSYFQRPTHSRQYSYPSKSEQIERLGFQPPPRPPQPGMKSESPRYESSSRAQYSPPASGWARPEFFSRDTSSSFRAHTEHRPPPPLPIHRPEIDSSSSYRESHLPATPNFPPTPASTVVGESNATKDALGPKIWTGTQFLPRFVRQAEVPGEGLCYFYDDGTHCKTVIDGEVVNAHWGVTKAGKPRKRLAIACITCREKKIKCDPDYPRCVQCEKFGRVCKFKNA